MNKIELFSHNQDDWKTDLKQSIRSSSELMRLMGSSQPTSVRGESDFPVLIPKQWLQKIDFSNPNDPLLKQVFPAEEESHLSESLSTDPLQESNFTASKSLIRKYHNRVLIILATGCGINCRYCFRRHFPYSDHRLGKQHTTEVIDYLLTHSEIDEVILSGGDPLLLDDAQLDFWLSQLEQVPSLRAIRIHTRLPVAIPSRLTHALKERLEASRLLSTLVFHINHPNEIDTTFEKAVEPYVYSRIRLLNQSVLLKGVNDQVGILKSLSWRLFEAGIEPYYLHLPDPVQNTQHFQIDRIRAEKLLTELRQETSGHLVPRLVLEEPNELSKTLIC